MFKVKVESWGDSLAIRLPDDFAADLGLKEGDEVDFEVEDGVIVIIKKLPSKANPPSG